MEPSLNGCREKLRRAEKDIVELSGLVKPYEEPLPVRILLDPELDQPNPEAHVFVDRALPEIDASILVFMGHIVHDLRCALDYLAHELTALGKGRFENSQFPIADSPERLTSRDKKTLEHMTPQHRAFIERLQPYDGRNPHFAVLRDLSNRDKHRLLVAQITNIDLSEPLGLITLLKGRDVYISLNQINGGALDPQTPLGSFRVTVRGAHPHVEVDHSLPVQVGIKEAGWGAVDVLKTIRAKIVESIEEVAQDFPA